MHPRKQEFIRLFEATGWSQAELARQIGMTRGGVNGLVAGDTVPSESALKLLRLSVAVQPSMEASALHDAPAGDLEIWRRRAKTAERQLADLRDGLRELLEKSASSKLDAIAERHIAAEAADIQSRAPRRQHT